MNNVIFGASWRTTLIGYVAAILVAIMPLIQNNQWPDWNTIAIAAFLAISGRFVKDANVQGPDTTKG